jgi:hypothetical protein
LPGLERRVRITGLVERETCTDAGLPRPVGGQAENLRGTPAPLLAVEQEIVNLGR